MKIRNRLMIGTVVGMLSVTSLFADGLSTQINIDGKTANKGFIEKGTTYVPLRSVAEMLGAIVDWDANLKEATISKGHTTIIQRVGKDTAKVNNRVKDIGSEALVKDGITYVPLRFVSENLGSEIEWDSKTKSVNMYSKGKSEEVETVKEVVKEVEPVKEVVKEESVNKDLFGRNIRTTDLPKNSSLYSEIIGGVPNKMYEVKQKWELVDWGREAFEGEDYLSTKRMKDDKWYTDSNRKLWVDILNKHLKDKLNVDYKTVDSNWVDRFSSTYADASEDDRYLIDIKEYVTYLKNNRIVIEGTHSVEPSITYNLSGQYYTRVYVKFIIKSDKVRAARLYQRINNDLKTNVWYERYKDIALSSNNMGSDGSDLKIDFDSLLFW